jgi:hypothetical protein
MGSPTLQTLSIINLASFGLRFLRAARWVTIAPSGACSGCICAGSARLVTLTQELSFSRGVRGSLQAHITTPKLHALYARAKEQEGRYEEAAAAYDRAKDTDNVVRVLLTLLDAPQKAFALVRPPPIPPSSPYHTYQQRRYVPQLVPSCTGSSHAVPDASG